MKRRCLLFALTIVALLAAVGLTGSQVSVVASPGAVTVREPAFGLPHIYADTDAELAREAGRQVAKDRLGQIVLVSRVARGTLSQAFGLVAPSTFNDDVEVRQDGYTSSELNAMFLKLPASEQELVVQYSNGVNDVIEEIYAGNEPEPLEVSLLLSIGLGDDLFGNATDVSDQVDPFYRAPGGADPQRPNAGYQFTPELAMAIGVLQVQSFGSESFGEVSRLTELNALIDKFGSSVGAEIWDDLNFLNDPLAGVSVPDPATPGFGGPLVKSDAPQSETPALASAFPGVDFEAALEADRERQSHREEFARSLGAWPAMGSYAWMIDGDRSDTGNPWMGGFPQTGFQTPSIMHFTELRSAEGADHRIQAMGMTFVGAPLVLIGQTDNVGYTSTTAQLKNNDFVLDRLILENTDALRYDDEGTPAPVRMRTDQIRDTDGVNTPLVVWRTHERVGNGGSRTVEVFQGDATGVVESATGTTLVDTGAFAADFTGGHVAIIGGTGAGQMRPVVSNTDDTLTLAGGDAWTVPPDTTSEYVAVEAATDIVLISRERAFWLEESQTVLGFAQFQRAESVLDIRRGTRMMPSTHNFLAADNQPFNGIGADLGPGTGNTGYFSGGFSRVRQGVSPTDTRLPMDGGAPNELIVVSGTVDGAAAGTLTSTATFTGRDFAPPAFNFRLDNPSEKGSEYIVTITGGTGYKQTRRIAANTDDVLTLEEEWGINPAPGDLFEVYEIVALPEAINPPQGYTANWNNKAATADDGRTFGRQFRHVFILERLAADTDWTRDEQRQLNKDLAGLDGKGKFGRFLVPRLREAVDAVGNGGNTDVDTVLAALEAHDAGPLFGRGFTDAVSDTTIAGEVAFLESLINKLSTAIYSDEFSGTGIGPPGGAQGLALVQHAIDSAAANPPGAYAQRYGGDYFNGTDWNFVVRDALADTIGDLGGIPADRPRPDTTYVHPLAALSPHLVFDPTPIGNRGVWEQIVEVGPTVLGEFIFPLGQSGFIDADGTPSRNAESLHKIWGEWRFAPMLHVAEDLAVDPDGDLDDDGVLDGFEKWYFGSNAPSPTSDADGDGLDLLGEFLTGLDPTDGDSDDDGVLDGADDEDQDGCSNQRELGDSANLGGQRDPLNVWDFMDMPAGVPPDRDGAVSARDIAGIVQRFGATDSGDGTFSRHSDPLATPDAPVEPAGSRENYHPAFDRGGTIPGQNLWNLLSPDGSIAAGDIAAAVAQFGHVCA